tara:strand:+ start:1666 stop:1824 length:159 start_codon:yes stop_codon:yes gene_type:complete
MNAHVENIADFLEWVKKCKYKFVISSMQGGHVHVKFLVPYEKINRKEEKENE